jgi:hypothetical protein
MEVGQGPNWGCSAKWKKSIANTLLRRRQLFSFNKSVRIFSWYQTEIIYFVPFILHFLFFQFVLALITATLLHISLLKHWIRLYLYASDSAVLYVKLSNVQICENYYGLRWAMIVQSVLGLATGWMTEVLRVHVPVGSIILPSPRRLHRLWGLPSLLSNGYWGSFSGGKAEGREADNSRPTRAKVKKTWIYTSIPPYVFMA